MSDIYKYAAQTRLRFPSNKGDLTVEHLFQLPLKSASGCDLDTVAREINSELKGVSEESFVEDAKSNPARKQTAIMLDIVKDVIATRRAAAKAVADQRDLKAKRDKLLDALAAAEGKALSGLSVEDLKKRLDALDAPTPAA